MNRKGFISHNYPLEIIGKKKIVKWSNFLLVQEVLLNNIPACFEAISLQSLDLFWGKASTLQNPPFFQTIQLKDLRPVAILSYCKTSLRENTCTIIKFLFWTIVFLQNAHEKKCLFCCCLWMHTPICCSIKTETHWSKVGVKRHRETNGTVF